MSDMLSEVYRIKFTKQGREYLKNNLINVKRYEYAVNCYEISMLKIFGLFRNDLNSLLNYIEFVKDGEEKSLCGSGGCLTCPFSCGEEAENVYNYACLPETKDIIRMKIESGHNWGCHSDESKICGGFAKYIKDNNLKMDVNKGGIISYNNWYLLGEKDALKMLDIEE